MDKSLTTSTHRSTNGGNLALHNSRIQSLSVRLSQKPDTVDDVMRGMEATIRKRQDREACLAEIAAMIGMVAVTYCGVNLAKSPPEIMAASLDLVTKEFQDIGAHEIGTAFRMAGAGKLAVDITAYGGYFTAGHIGRVLTAYMAERGRMVVGIMRAQEEERVEMAKSEAVEANRRTLDEWRRKYEDAVAMREEEPFFQKWEDIPYRWAVWVIRHSGLVPDDPTRREELRAEAKAIVKRDTIKRKEALDELSTHERASIREQLSSFNEGRVPFDLQGRVVAVYTRLIIWDYVKASWQ